MENQEISQPDAEYARYKKLLLAYLEKHPEALRSPQNLEITPSMQGTLKPEIIERLRAMRK